MTTTDIIALIGLTALFAIFAATMAGAEMMLRRHVTVRTPAQRPRERKG